MKKISILLLLLFFWNQEYVWSDLTPPRIMNSPNFVREEQGVIKAAIYDDSGIESAILYYRKPGESYYRSIEMRRDDEIFYRDIGRELGIRGPVEYYMIARDVSGNTSTAPLLNPQENPFSTGGAENTPEIVLSNPRPGTVLETGDETVIIAFYNTTLDIDFNTVRLRFNQRDVTSEADFVGNLLIWDPRRAFPEGTHEIEVSARDTEGNLIGPNAWRFGVRTKRELPLGVEGDIYMGLQYDNRSGTRHNIPLWNNKIDFSLRGETGFLRWDMGAMLTSEETQYLTTEKLIPVQPINRYYFDVSGRRFRVRYGDSNPGFSDLTMKGILVRGLNAEIRTTRFQAQLVSGYNRRDISEDLRILARNVQIDPEDPSKYIDENGSPGMINSAFQQIIQDPVTHQFHVYDLMPGTFRRNVTAFQMDFVPVRNRFATFSFGLNAFAAEDDSTTLNYRYSVDRDLRFVPITNENDILDSIFVEYTPQKNWVGTIESTLRFNRDRSEIGVEFGGTIATENMFGTVTDEIRENMPEGIPDNLFRLNASTQTSFDKSSLGEDIAADIKNLLGSLYKIRLVTPLPVPWTSTFLRGEVYRIPTHYVSLGNPQQRTDIGGYKGDIRTRVFRDQLTLSGGYDFFMDNLDQERMQYSAVDEFGTGTEQKDLDKTTEIYYWTVDLRPKILPVFSPTVSVGFRNYSIVNNLDLAIAANDTIYMIDTVTETSMLSIGGVIPAGSQRHTTNISYSGMTINDRRPLANYDLAESENHSLHLNVNSALNPLPITVSTSLGRTVNSSYRKVNGGNGGYSRHKVDTNIDMINFALTYRWFRDRRLGTTIGGSFMKSLNEETGSFKIDNYKDSLRFEMNYRLSSVSSIAGMVRYNRYIDNVIKGNGYNQPVAGVTLMTAY